MSSYRPAVSSTKTASEWLNDIPSRPIRKLARTGSVRAPESGLGEEAIRGQAGSGPRQANGREKRNKEGYHVGEGGCCTYKLGHDVLYDVEEDRLVWKGWTVLDDHVTWNHIAFFKT